MTSLESIQWDDSQSFEQFKAAHFAGIEAWKLGEEAPSIHRPVARVDVGSRFDLDQITRELALMNVQRYPSEGLHGKNILHDLGDAFMSEQFSELMLDASRLLRQVIDEETGLGETVAVEAALGPYRPLAENYKWHRDTDPSPYEENTYATWTWPILGPATIFTNASFFYTDFDGEYLRKQAYPRATDNVTYELGTIAMHDGSLSAHRGPGTQYARVPRLLFRAFVKNVFRAA